MAKPLMLSIGGTNTPLEAPSTMNEPAATSATPVPDAPLPAESLAGIYEVLKRHEETLRDLVIEVRLLYHNQSDKDKKRLEARRDATTREVRETFAAQIRSLEETIARLRAAR